MKKLFPFLIAAFILTPRSFATDSRQDLDTLRTSKIFQPVYAPLLQGDMKSGLELMKNIPESSLTPLEKKYQKDFLDRFARTPEPLSDPTMPAIYNDLMKIYESYWRSVALRETSLQAAESLLRDKMERLLLSDVKPLHPKPLAQLQALAKARLWTHGIKSVMDRTAPYQEFMAWRTETPVNYKVELIDSTQTTEVVLMDDFLSLGWMHYLTMGLFLSGGWAETDKLYCVKPFYDLESEMFQISFLKHETQHFTDYKRFPGLTGAVLEYRAKLTELAFTRNPNIFQLFIMSAADKSPSPHSQANFWVIRDMTRRAGVSTEGLLKLPITDINRFARELLMEDSQLRQRKVRKSDYT